MLAPSLWVNNSLSALISPSAKKSTDPQTHEKHLGHWKHRMNAPAVSVMRKPDPLVT